MTGRSRCRWARAATSGTTPPKRRVQVGLRGDDVGKHPWLVGEDGRGGFVAGGFDGEEEHCRKRTPTRLRRQRLSSFCAGSGGHSFQLFACRQKPAGCRRPLCGSSLSGWPRRFISWINSGTASGSDLPQSPAEFAMMRSVPTISMMSHGPRRRALRRRIERHAAPEAVVEREPHRVLLDVIDAARAAA